MCSHYEFVKDRNTLKNHFKIDAILEGEKPDMWPGYLGAFIRKRASTETGGEALFEREMLLGSFGLIPHWATDTKIARNTYNARSETVAEKPSFRDAWRANQRCIIPANAFFEPDWSSGKAVPARISRADGKPMGIAGLWSAWKAPRDGIILSFTMLTINADSHQLMCRFHKPTDEKRMVVILPDDQYSDWLGVKTEECRHFLKEYPSELLVTNLSGSPR